jgi:hypothetical protein
MEPNVIDEQPSTGNKASSEEKAQFAFCGDQKFTLRRWLISFASDREFYPVGQFVALDSASAIGRAIEVFGPAADYQAEEIPWDAAPLARFTPWSKYPAKR